MKIKTLKGSEIPLGWGVDDVDMTADLDTLSCDHRPQVDHAHACRDCGDTIEHATADDVCGFNGLCGDCEELLTMSNANEDNGTGPRSTVRHHAPRREGSGSSRTWTRTLRGVPHRFTAVLMPNGERRYAVTRYNGYGDDGTAEGRRSGMRFGCAWSQVAFWTVNA